MPAGSRPLCETVADGDCPWAKSVNLDFCSTLAGHASTVLHILFSCYLSTNLKQFVHYAKCKCNKLLLSILLSC